MANYGAGPALVGLPPVPLQSYFFGEVCSSFFMSLFFFWSGYFSPRSLNKKGTYAFLFDKLKRLGIPWLIITFVLGPYVNGSLVYVFFLKEQYQGISYLSIIPLANSSVAWFPQELVVFNIVFAFACGEGWKPKVKCPSLLSFFGISLTLGGLAGVISIFIPFEAELFNVPSGWFWYPSYVVFFFGGALAQTNNWMDSIKDKSRLAIYCWAIASVVGLVTLVVVQLVLKEDGEYLPPLLRQFLYKLTQVAIGIPISLAVTVFFHDFVNRKFAVTPFFSKAMYTAYLIQFLGPNWIAIKCWILILGAIGSDGHIGGGLQFAGLMFRSVMALILSWTLGYAIVSIPGFSQVL